MDIFGIPGVEAEAELLSAIVLSFQQMGLSAKDVGIKINSRRILNDLMKKVGISQDKWIPCCVVVDKLEKVPLEALQKDIETIGVSLDAMKELTTYLKVSYLSYLVCSFDLIVFHFS
jgi:histidyl-tRNA synthetase